MYGAAVPPMYGGGPGDMLDDYDHMDGRCPRPLSPAHTRAPVTPASPWSVSRRFRR
jgi:hypothetical protein|eukprot:COSAG01_NODE_5283_length_4357_cov_369.903711_1_plen_56_part_00